MGDASTAASLVGCAKEIVTTAEARSHEASSSLEKRPVGVVLGELKSKLNSITDYFDSTKRIVYYDYPIYASNIGDLLIHLGTEKFFEANGIAIWRRFNMLDLPRQIRHMDDDVVILCHGGGNFGDVWPGSQAKRESLIARYPRNRIVVLPQTVHYSSAAQTENSMRILRAHKNLHIFARDRISERVLLDGGLSASCMPDMYHALEGTLDVPPPTSRGRVLKICRTDHEAGTGVGAADPEATATDWMQIVGSPCRMLARCVQATMIGLRIANVQSPSNYKLWYPLRDLALRRGIRFFLEYDVVYTDRLHAMLLGLLLRREVHAFDNSYGKLSSYYDCWLRGTEGLEF